jgi:hypothetical protein
MKKTLRQTLGVNSLKSFSFLSEATFGKRTVAAEFERSQIPSANLAAA